MPLIPIIGWVLSSALATAAIVFGWDAAQKAGEVAGAQAGKQIAETEKTVGSGLNLLLLAGVGLIAFWMTSEALKQK